MVKNFDEFTRIQLPAVVHLTRLGYEYISYSENKSEFDHDSNIITKELKENFLKLNSHANDDDFENEYKKIKLELNLNDLGKSFFNRIQGNGDSNFKWIDWENFDNNSFKMAIEVPCGIGDNNFRPDITLFINGLPLSFIEVKKPNAIRDNTTGIKSEFMRMSNRLQNKKNKVFNNITQIISFSDNMNYDLDDSQQMQGSYYATTGLKHAYFNSMHEERYGELVDRIHKEKEDVVDYILKDTNKIVLKNSPEFKLNCKLDTPTNKFLTSVYDKNRLKFFLHFGITYVDSIDENGNKTVQKQIMRYPQYFATRKISEKIDNGMTRGIIWHTQGSGKTALAFYNIKYLKYKYSKKNIVPHFFFVVDRLDLANQAKKEFQKRGLKVKLITSKTQLKDDINQSQDISVVNIQKINEETDFTNNSGYDLNTQNIYFIDEAHRSYNEKGSYLSNLYNADKKAIKIALTGTPLINIDHKNTSRATTKDIFGDYIHKYYYNQSIEDGYTLRLLREEIGINYKEKLNSILSDEQKKVKKGSLNTKILYAQPQFVKPMLSYIINDFSKSRELYGDDSIGGMIVSNSSEQAREMYKQFMNKKSNGETDLTAALILYDEKNKEENIQKFKDGNIDILIVYNMLLTGFDAPRLKKLYLGRTVKGHNLLQTLTRVNRPYKDFRMGFIVDFANISKEFDKTNHAYFEELNNEYGNSIDTRDIYGSLFVSSTEIEESLEKANLILSKYNLNNLEEFNNQINKLDSKELSNLSKTLKDIKDYYNISKLMSYDNIVDEIKEYNVSILLNMVSDRIQTVNLIKSANDESGEKLIKLAIDGLDFGFKKIGETDLNMSINNFIEKSKQISVSLDKNWDHADPEWVSLVEEFKRILSKQDITKNDLSNIEFNVTKLNEIIDRINTLNKKNREISDSFDNDYKYARVYKRANKNINRKNIKDSDLYYILKTSKERMDDKVSKNRNMVENAGYFTTEAIATLRQSCRDKKSSIPMSLVKQVAKLLTDEYEKEIEKVGF